MNINKGGFRVFNKLILGKVVKAVIDLDDVRNRDAHDEYNNRLSDEELIDSWVSRKLRGKKTWQMEREIRARGLMDRCLKRLNEVTKS